MQKSIYLFRHGSVSDKNIFCGWLNLPLDKKGILQAKNLAKKMKKEKIDYGFCSDQLRSEQCLAEVLKYHKSAKVIIDPRIRERHYGVFSGQSKDRIKEIHPEIFAYIHRDYNAHIPDGENFAEMTVRVFSFMGDLMRFMQKEKCNIAISAHTNSLRLIQEYLEGVSRKEAEKLEHHPLDFKKYTVNFD
jgi:broad specificity phosphatase PhoE